MYKWLRLGICCKGMREDGSPTQSVYIDGDIKLLYILHFSLFLYYAISILIIYYLIIIIIVISQDGLHFSPGYKMFIYRNVITSEFTLW